MNPSYVRKNTESTRSTISPDGTFQQQRIYFTTRFGTGSRRLAPVPHRYTLIGSPLCGWNRRLRIVLRLLGLDEVISTEDIFRQQEGRWILSSQSVGKQFGYAFLDDFYAATDPAYVGRATSPTLVDNLTGNVVSNNYHVLNLDFETAWEPFHKEGAPDLYPESLRPWINLLNQQLYDDINIGTYAVVYATTYGAAHAAYEVFRSRLVDLDFRLSSRRYLLGDKITDSDVHLFQTLVAFDAIYRPGFEASLGEDIIHLWDFDNVWAYARDLFATPGFIDEREKIALGLIPDEKGNYHYGFGWKSAVSYGNVHDSIDHDQYLRQWLEPAHRESLQGSAQYSGPGGGGSSELWQFA